MADDAGIPPSLASRPRSAAGLPIPFVNASHPDGSPDFTVVDARRSLEAARTRTCALCAHPLGYWVAFLGGPKSIHDRAFVDGPSHEECLEAATRLCPYLSRRTTRRSATPGSDALEPLGFDADKPIEIFIGITRTYTTLVVPQGGVVHRAAPFKRVRRFLYEGGVLTEDRTSAERA
jgi:hypothetical protein